MGRRKRGRALLRPFCFYCDRQFDEEKVLVQHQKAKHFKCLQCSRKLDTAAGLVVHMLQVHKESLSRVPNALPGRECPDTLIHGMQGVPPEMILERQEKLEEDTKKRANAAASATMVGGQQVTDFVAAAPPGIKLPPGLDPKAHPYQFSSFISYLGQSGVQAAFTAMFGFAPDADEDGGTPDRQDEVVAELSFEEIRAKWTRYAAVPA